MNRKTRVRRKNKKNASIVVHSKKRAFRRTIIVFKIYDDSLVFKTKEIIVQTDEVQAN